MTNPTVHRFRHDAMATVFEIFINHTDRNYAEQASVECFRLVDNLEQLLSFFIPNSDVSRINKSMAGDIVGISPDCFYCLEEAMKYNIVTYGAFDPFTGFLKNQRTSGMSPDSSAGKVLDLNPYGFKASILKAPVNLDLGGIGKGYTVEKISKLLKEWEIDHFLVHGGKSSVFASGNYPDMEGWTVSISEPGNDKRIIKNLILNESSVSSSGLEKGRHIYDPFKGRLAPDDRSIWVFGSDSIITECLSTACIILSVSDIENLVNIMPGVSVVFYDKLKRTSSVYGSPGHLENISLY